MGALGGVGTWLLLLILFCCAQIGAQSIYSVAAPPADGSNTGVQAPNGTTEHAYHRSAVLVDGASLRLLPAGTTVTRLGFVITKGAGAKVNGSLTVYLSNTPTTMRVI